MIGRAYNNPVQRIRAVFKLCAYKSARQLAWQQDPVWLAVAFRRTKVIRARCSPRAGNPHNAWNVNFNNGNVNDNHVDNENRARCVR